VQEYILQTAAFDLKTQDRDPGADQYAQDLVVDLVDVRRIPVGCPYEFQPQPALQLSYGSDLHDIRHGFQSLLCFCQRVRQNLNPQGIAQDDVLLDPANDLGHGASGNDLANVQDDHIITDAFDFREQVTAQHNAGVALARDPLHQFEQLLLASWVEP